MHLALAPLELVLGFLCALGLAGALVATFAVTHVILRNPEAAVARDDDP